MRTALEWCQRALSGRAPPGEVPWATSAYNDKIVLAYLLGRDEGHPAKLQLLLGFGNPTPREEKYLKKYDLGTDLVALTDQGDVQFRMVDNSAEVSEGTDNIARGPLLNMVPSSPRWGSSPARVTASASRSPS